MKRFCHSETCPEYVTLRETKGLKGRSEESFLYSLNWQSKGRKSKVAVHTVCRTLSSPKTLALKYLILSEMMILSQPKRLT